MSSALLLFLDLLEFECRNIFILNAFGKIIENDGISIIFILCINFINERNLVLFHKLLVVPDLHKVFVVVGINHKLTIITIFTGIFHRVEKQNFASIVAFNGNAVPILGNIGGANLHQAAFFGAAMIAFPLKGIGAVDRNDLHCSNIMVEELKKVQKKDDLACTFSNDFAGISMRIC
jgi:hypothetical protein